VNFRYPQNLSEFSAVLFDFSLFKKLSNKGLFTIIVENIEDFCETKEEIARLTAAVLGATPYNDKQVN